MLRERLESKFSLSGKPFQNLKEKSVLITYSVFPKCLNNWTHNLGILSNNSCFGSQQVKEDMPLIPVYKEKFLIPQPLLVEC